jgi:hypothetical protein
MSSVERGSVLHVTLPLPEHGAHVGDVSLLNGHREHQRAPFRIRPLVRKVSGAACDPATLEDVTRPGSTRSA